MRRHFLIRRTPSLERSSVTPSTTCCGSASRGQTRPTDRLSRPCSRRQRWCGTRLTTSCLGATGARKRRLPPGARPRLLRLSASAPKRQGDAISACCRLATKRKRTATSLRHLRRGRRLHQHTMCLTTSGWLRRTRHRTRSVSMCPRTVSSARAARRRPPPQRSTAPRLCSVAAAAATLRTRAARAAAAVPALQRPCGNAC
mmetsp:Transcript_35749/g.105676  ORF Transcript_35749/g.105676 Transcript_35749/m.105676 type:complete len:201 (+) Transcript_35749:623-1225(+)